MKLDYAVTLSPRQAHHILLLLTEPIELRLRELQAVEYKYHKLVGVRIERMDLGLQMKAAADELLQLLDTRAKMLCVIAYHDEEHEND